MIKTVEFGNIRIGQDTPLLLIAGPCVIENRDMVLRLAEEISAIADRHGISYVFKASFDKANRTSIASFRGPGLEAGLEILNLVKTLLEIPVLTDIHLPGQATPAGEVVDILQIPAFLCRQTDLLVSAGKTGAVINVKKGQFMAPQDMLHVVKKIRSTGNEKILLTERGSSFGYQNLVSDFRSIPIMQKTGCPVIFDATHSVQQPGGQGATSGGKREYVPLLAKCAVTAGCQGVFMEVHQDPDHALSDGPNMLPLHKLEKLIVELKALHLLRLQQEEENKTAS